MERIQNGRYAQEFREESVKMAKEKVLIIDVDKCTGCRKIGKTRLWLPDGRYGYGLVLFVGLRRKFRK